MFLSFAARRNRIGMSGALAVAAMLVTGMTAEAQQSAAQCKPAATLQRVPELPEGSGLAASHRTPGRFWSHNDSGEPVLFALYGNGRVTGRLSISGADGGGLGSGRRWPVSFGLVHLCSGHRRQRRGAKADYRLSHRGTCRRERIGEGRRHLARHISGRFPRCRSVAGHARRALADRDEGRHGPRVSLPISKRAPQRHDGTAGARRRTT